MLLGEIFGSGGDEVDVRALVEYEARGLDWISKALDAGDATGAKGGAIHQQRIELNSAGTGEEAASSGIEGVVVFEDGDCGFNRLDGCGAIFENGVADGKGIRDASRCASIMSSGMAQAPPWTSRVGVLCIDLTCLLALS